MLQFWEREWWHALRFLRDGIKEPGLVGWRFDPPEVLQPGKQGKILQWRGRGTDVEGRRDLWDELVKPRSLKNPRSTSDLEKLCIRWESWLSDLTGREAFAKARAAGILEQPREKWPEELKQLPKVNPAGPAGFPAPGYVRQYARQFLEAINNKRFPRRRKSASAARLDYLARAMAGVFCGVAPATGVDRLRRIHHDLASKQHVEACWRCYIERSQKALESKLRHRSMEITREHARYEQAWYTALALHPTWTLLEIAEPKPGSGHWKAKYGETAERAKKIVEFGEGTAGPAKVVNFFIKENEK